MKINAKDLKIKISDKGAILIDFDHRNAPLNEVFWPVNSMSWQAFYLWSLL